MPDASDPSDFSSYSTPSSARPPTPPAPDAGDAASTRLAPWDDGMLAAQVPVPPSTVVGHPPLVWIAAAAASALAGIAVALVVGDSGLAVVAWLLAGPLAIGLLTRFSARDVREQALPVYSRPPSTSVGYWLVVGVAVVGLLLSAWRMAYWVGRS